MDEKLEFKSFQIGSMGMLFIKIFLSILIFFSVCVTLLGLINLLSTENILSSLPYLIFGSSFFIFLLLGLLSIKWNKRYQIISSRFDLKESKYKIKMQNGDESFIPFSEIKSFAIRQHIVKGKNSNTVYHVLHLVKKDDAFWDIESYRDENEALSFLSILQTEVKLNEGPIYIETEKSENFTIKEDSFNSIIHWKGKVFLFQTIFSYTAILSFIGLFFYMSFFVIGMELGIFTYIIFAIFSIFLMGILYSAYTTFISYKEFELEIDEKNLKLFGIKGKAKKEIANQLVSEIKNTQFQFDMFTSKGNQGFEIYILNKETESLISKIKSGPKEISEIMGFLKESMSFHKKVLKLKFWGFTPIEVINFERELDRVLKKYNSEIN